MSDPLTIIVVPVDPATQVVDPPTGRLVPPDGIAVRDSEFWRRRIADGDFRLIPSTPAQPKEDTTP